MNREEENDNHILIEVLNENGDLKLTKFNFIIIHIIVNYYWYYFIKSIRNPYIFSVFK